MRQSGETSETKYDLAEMAGALAPDDGATGTGQRRVGTTPTPSREVVLDPLGQAGQYSLARPSGGDDTNQHSPRLGAKKSAADRVAGMTLGECGAIVLQRILEVLPLRSQTMGKGDHSLLYPLPTSRDTLYEAMPNLTNDELSWLLCVTISLNSVWGGVLFYEGRIRDVQMKCLETLAEHVRALCASLHRCDLLQWESFMKVRAVDYRGEEVKVARWFDWSNIAPALPKEVGSVALADVCELGSKHFVLNVDDYLRPEHEWGALSAPRVMVEDASWGEVCRGLVATGVCTFIEESEIFHVGSKPLLNGLFGVPKEETTEEGIEIFRLIMNLIPFNQISMPMAGDVGTLPSWSMMTPLFLQPSQHLLVTSEDVKCFFYTMELPPVWTKYLAFNKPVPQSVLPQHLIGKEVYIASRVLPMGYLNSVSLAQHVRRVLVKSSTSGERVNLSNQELRKDRPFSTANPLWRVYLDNYDLLERVESTGMVDIQGTPSAGVLALRQSYEHWSVPRNVKKAVERQPVAEMQGATVDGIRGVAFPREAKLCRYLSLALQLLDQASANQKQWQVTCGGLVYVSMFRRPLLGTLNKVWQHIEEFTSSGKFKLNIPDDCRLEVVRFLGLLPLARLNFWLPMDPVVSCSDASTSGGGVCASVRTSALGSLVSRGDRGDPVHGSGVLVVGLFDGISSLRVALELLGTPILGQVSVEKHGPAKRVVETHFPDVLQYDLVEDISLDIVKTWSTKFSQAEAVVLGAGPPCQGVSGLNADRKGAIRDARSSLYVHVPRIRTLLQQCFPWCAVYSIMESVASMDNEDRALMSEAFGSEPLLCDAACLCWCHRPRLYWLDWELQVREGTRLRQDPKTKLQEVIFEGSQNLSKVIRAGWKKVDTSKAFPTFTTSRPSAKAGRKPAGVRQCSESELQRWSQDLHRFPPYQYCTVHCVVNKAGQLRLPDVSERETLMGFPLHFTTPCLPKAQRQGAQHNDCRLTLLGNAWNVPVVACLLEHLLAPLGIVKYMHPQEVIDQCFLENIDLVQGRLYRLPLNPPRGLVPDQSLVLAQQLGCLVSVKGEDVMLNAPSSNQPKFQRMRATVPSRLWKWRIVAGWQWRSRQEHINALELRAVLTSLKWRIEHKMDIAKRFVHLTDRYAVSSAMPKRKLVEGTEPRERAKQRQQLGTLRQLTVQPATRKRYDNAVSQFLVFLRREGQPLPRDKKLLDPLVCDYVEHLWSSGAGRALANDTLAGLQDSQPNLRGSLPGAWRLLKTWSINEVPSRAPPLPEHILQAMAGWAFFNKHFTFGISLVVGYYGMLRSGEIISLLSSHIMVSAQDSQLLVSLGMTKSGRRQGAAESVVLGVELAVKLVNCWKKQCPTVVRLASSPGKWRTLFHECLQALGLETFEFRPYSLRRGGATWWFQKHQNLDRILVQGTLLECSGGRVPG
eukprot:Skav235744  [mRNA]  locus=scaffold1612:147414:153104:- [translate_table: standard]